MFHSYQFTNTEIPAAFELIKPDYSCFADMALARKVWSMDGVTKKFIIAEDFEKFTEEGKNKVGVHIAVAE